MSPRVLALAVAALFVAIPTTGCEGESVAPPWCEYHFCGDGGDVDGGTVEDGGSDAAPDAPVLCADGQDPTCPDAPHGVTCRFYPGGPCAVLVCDPGWNDCNGQIHDGCETGINIDPDNCGGCWNVCPPTMMVCESGMCGG